MPRKRKKKDTKSTPLSEYLKKAFDDSEMTLGDLEDKTDIPDATLSRILSGETKDPKTSQIGRIVIALGLSFWKVMERANITIPPPSTPKEEAQRIAAIIADEPELKTTMEKLVFLAPKDRDAVLRMIDSYRQDGQNDPPAPQGFG